MTGFQKYHFTQEENINMVTNSLENGNKIFYLQKRLTGALDSYKKGRQVSMISRISCFKTVFDTKRKIIHDDNKTMKISNPYNNMTESLLERILLKNYSQSIYSGNLTNKTTFVSSFSAIEETIKFFIRKYINYYNYDFNHKELRDLILRTISKLSQIVSLNKKVQMFNENLIYSMINKVMLRKGVIQNGLTHCVNSRLVTEALIRTMSEMQYNKNFIRFMKNKLDYSWYERYFIYQIDSIQISLESLDKVLSKIHSRTEKPKKSKKPKPSAPFAFASHPVPSLLVPWPELLPVEELVLEEQLKKTQKTKKTKISRVPSSPSKPPVEQNPASVASPSKPFGKPLGPPPTPKYKTTKKYEDKFGHRGTPKKD